MNPIEFYNACIWQGYSIQTCLSVTYHALTKEPFGIAVVFSVIVFLIVVLILNSNKVVNEFLNENKNLNLEVYLIYSNDSGVLKTYISEGLKEELEEQI